MVDINQDKDINFYKLFLFFYLPLKIFAICLILLITQNFDPNYSILGFTDSNYYFNCDENTVNFLFAYTSCLLGIESTFSWQAILITFLLSSLRDLIYFKIADKFLPNYVGVLIFIFFLALHPYSAIYSIKYTTDLYGSLGVLLIAYQITFNKNNMVLFLMATVLIFFRNNLLLIISAYYYVMFAINIIHLQSKKSIENLMYIFLLLLIGLSFTNTMYMDEQTYLYLFLSENFPFSLTNHLLFLELESNLVNYILTAPIYLLTHIFLLTGFRESVYVIGISSLFSSNITFGYMQFIISLLLSLIHTLGLIYFFRITSKRLFYVLIFYVFPTFLILSHLRYFYPLIPLSLIGFSLILSKLFNINKKN